MLRTAVVIGLAALYETVEASGLSHVLPFDLDADGCVVGYQPECAAQRAPTLCSPMCTASPAHLDRGSAPACAASTTTPLRAVRRL